LKKDGEVLIGCLALVGILAVAPVLVVLNGWVLSVLWGWFVVPALGLPTLSIPLAIGLCSVAQVLRPVPTDYAKDKDSTTATRLVGYALAPFVALGFGAIVHLFV
jgi:hypothetical protein